MNDELIKEWMAVGHTLEEATELAELSNINVDTIGKITSEEASSYLTEVMSKYKAEQI